MAELPFFLESPELVVEFDFSADPDFSEPPELLDPPSEDEDDDPLESPSALAAPPPLLEADAEAALGSLPRESLR